MDVEIHPKYISEEVKASLKASDDNPKKILHDGFNIAFGIICVEEDMGDRLPAFTSVFKLGDKRMAQLCIGGYPAYIDNPNTRKSEINYNVYSAKGTLKEVSTTEVGGTIAIYDDLYATTGQDGGPLLASRGEFFDYDSFGVHNGYNQAISAYTATLITEDMFEQWIMPICEKYGE